MTNSYNQELGAEGPVQDYVRSLLRQNLADEQARQGRIQDSEKSGRRIINGGQTGRSEDGSATWEITDWRTGELIESGTGDYEAFRAALERLDPDESWIHIGNLSDMDTTEAEVPTGIPDSLAQALQDWLSSAATTDEDVAQFVGWPVDEVNKHREQI